MQQRYYDPIAGRFLSVDPVVTDANTGKGFGLYTYVDNNPYSKIDPDGRLSNDDCRQTANCEVLVDNGNSTSRSGNSSTTSKSTGAAATTTGLPLTGAAATSGEVAAAGSSSWLFRLIGAAGLALAPSSLGDGSLAAGSPFNIQKSDSRELGENLVNVGASRDHGVHAHHIVAAGDARAAPARLVLAAAGMSINDPHNGIFLNAATHQRIHTDTYYTAVNIALTGATGYRDVSMRLMQIYGAIQAGTFPR